MDKKSIRDIKNIDIADVTFTVRKISKNNKNEYVADVEIETTDWKKVHFKNTSIREVLYHLGEAVLDSEDMEVISQYVYEYNKCLLIERGEEVDFNWPGYMSFGSVKGKKEIHLNNHSGYRRYEGLEDMLKDAKLHTTSKRYEAAVRKQIFGHREL